VRSALTEAGISSIAFGVATEPSIERVRAGVALVAETGCDAVLGFGGGSALDVGKAVAVLATSGADPLDHLEVIGDGRPITRPGLPCVAVPTTAGTGSEVTRNSVLSGGGVKASLRSPLMLPKVAVVDPDLLIGLPQRPVEWMLCPSSSSLCCHGAPTHSPMRWPVTGCAAQHDRWVGRTKKEWKIQLSART
jgi:alcohol dehydrogenase class IV